MFHINLTISLEYLKDVWLAKWDREQSEWSEVKSPYTGVELSTTKNDNDDNDNKNESRAKRETYLATR